MPQRDISSLRGMIEFLRERGDILTVTGEVDPEYEISGIQKKLDDGPALLFEHIKGYPGARNIGNIYSREQRVADIFGVPHFKDIKFRFAEAIRKPLPPEVVSKAPCQETVITENIDAPATLPLLKHSEEDVGRILGGGITLVTKPHYAEGSDLAFKRMHFRGKDWASINIARGSHLSYAAHRKGRTEPIPITINIGTPPSLPMVAGSLTVHAIMPEGTDELGIAGGLQGFPVALCRAKTVDAYSVASSEWVIEGNISTERVWESEESERLKQSRVAPLFPEWSGYMGRAISTFKFQVTAITHRKDKPIFYTPLANSYEHENMNTPLREACLWEIARRMVPGLVTDISIPHAFKANLGAVFQVKKRSAADDAYPRNIVAAALPTATLRFAIIVDDDIDIHDTEDVLWAIATRANLKTGVFTGAPGSVGNAVLPFAAFTRKQEAWSEGGMVIDATVPFAGRAQFPRTRYPVDRVDLRRWFTPEQIAAVQAKQSPHARLLAETGG